MSSYGLILSEFFSTNKKKLVIESCLHDTYDTYSLRTENYICKRILIRRSRRDRFSRESHCHIQYFKMWNKSIRCSCRIYNSLTDKFFSFFLRSRCESRWTETIERPLATHIFIYNWIDWRAWYLNSASFWYIFICWKSILYSWYTRCSQKKRWIDRQNIKSSSGLRRSYSILTRKCLITYLIKEYRSSCIELHSHMRVFLQRSVRDSLDSKRAANIVLTIGLIDWKWEDIWHRIVIDLYRIKMSIEYVENIVVP